MFSNYHLQSSYMQILRFLSMQCLNSSVQKFNSCIQFQIRDFQFEENEISNYDLHFSARLESPGKTSRTSGPVVCKL